MFPFSRPALLITILFQLRKLVEAGVSQEELQQILNQLRTFARSAPPPPPASLPSVAPAPTYPATTSQSTYPSLIPQIVLPPGSQTAYGQPSDHTYTSFGQFKGEPIDPSSLTSVPDSQMGSATTTNSLSSLFQALVKAGVVSAATSSADAAKEESKLEPIDLERESARNYRNAVLAHPIKLTSADITKYVCIHRLPQFELTSAIFRRQPQIIQLLYDRLPVQCKQCGIRFADSTIGKKKMQDHLDMHFRQNRKANQSVGRGHSRSWFVDVEVCIRRIFALTAIAHYTFASTGLDS